MNALSKFSTEKPGHEAAYAVDNSSGTWWEPAATDSLPSLLIELSPATRFDVVQMFTIDGVRLMFNGGRRGLGRPAQGGQQSLAEIFQYKIEVSTDGKTFETALDQSRNTIARNTIFDEISPVKCRFVRLTVTNWPKASPLGLLEFTVFGKAAGALPAAVAIPVAN